MVAHTLNALAAVPRLAATLVVVSEDDDGFEGHVPSFAGARSWVARVGAATRAHSVANGLDELLARGVRPNDWVLVHDAARCLIQPEWVDRLIDACLDDEVGGLLALPLSDTLKGAADEPEGTPRARLTIDRADKWVAQTPQMFRLGLLRLALNAALKAPHGGAGITDEASAMEAFGHAPRLVAGDYENFKVTWPGDFALAARLLSSRPAPAAR